MVSANFIEQTVALMDIPKPDATSFANKTGTGSEDSSGFPEKSTWILKTKSLFKNWISNIFKASSSIEESSLGQNSTLFVSRKEMRKRLRQEHYHYERTNKPFSVIMGDIDRIRKINDAYGRECGDYILDSISNLIGNNLREQDFYSRWSGEEFLILLPQTNAIEGYAAAEALRRLIEQKVFEFNGNLIKTTISFGVETFDNSYHVGDLLKHVYRSLYQAKQDGRNKVVTN